MTTKPADDPILQYADQPIVGNVIVQRNANGVTVVLRRSDARLVQAAIIAAAGLGLLALVLLVGWNSKMLAQIWWWLVIVEFGLLSAAGAAAITGLRPVTVALDRGQLTLRWRQGLEIKTVQLERPWLADIRPKRLAFKETLFCPYVMEIVLFNGQRRRAFLAGRAEVEHAAKTLRDELALPPAHWFESAYPPRGRSLRVTRLINPIALTITIGPKLISPLFWIIAPLLLIACLVLAPWTLARTTLSQWTLLWSAIYFVLVGIPVLAIIYRLSTRRIITVDHEHVRSRETGLRPAEEEWPIGDVDEFTMEASGSRATLELILHSGQRVPILRERRRIVERIEADLRTALQLSRGQWLASLCAVASG